jgi:hypothetical protein
MKREPLKWKGSGRRRYRPHVRHPVIYWLFPRVIIPVGLLLALLDWLGVLG